MQQKLRGGGSRNVARVLAAFAAALVAVSLVPGGASAAAPTAPKPPKHAEIKMQITPAKANGQFGVASAASGGNAGDWNGDGKHDILARQADNSALKVYQHGGTYGGPATYEPAVNINYGWGSKRWIGTGRVNGDALSDVVAIDYTNGAMAVYEHSGSFNGTSTLGAVTFVGGGWYVNDLVFLHDINGDGFDDIIARRAGTDKLYLYLHNGKGASGTGINGMDTFGAPQELASGFGEDVEINMADVTKDGVPDLVFLDKEGWLGVYSPTNGGHVWWLSYGWETMNALSLADVNFDGSTDLLGRTKAGVLQAYRHSGTFSPTGEFTAYNTFLAPEYLGFGWNTNNVIS